MYAVFETGSKQYKVKAGDKLEVEKLDAPAGKTINFDRVLLVNKDGKVTVGTPTVPNAVIVGKVLEHKRGDKIIVWKMRRREGYHRKIGHRQQLTVIQIEQIKAE